MEQTKERTLTAALLNLNAKFCEPSYTAFLKDSPARNARLCDIDKSSHLFLIACLMDRQIDAEKAGNIPFELEDRLGHYDMPRLAGLDIQDIKDAMWKPAPLHRYCDVMAENLWDMAKKVVAKYNGNPAVIWSGVPSSATIIRRFLEFKGIGPKIATMATNILTRDLGVKVTEKSSIDISVDTHVERVMKRIGLCEPDASREIIIYRARELNPDYPAALDLPLWALGKYYCHAKRPSCVLDATCPLYQYCQWDMEA